MNKARSSKRTAKKQGACCATFGTDIGLPLLHLGGCERQLMADGFGPAVDTTAYHLLATIWGEIGLEVAGTPLHMPGGRILVVKPGAVFTEPEGRHKPGRFLYLTIAAHANSLSGSVFLEQDYLKLLATLDRHAGVVRPAGLKLMNQFSIFERLLHQWCMPNRPPFVTASLLRAVTCATILRFAARLEEASIESGPQEVSPIIHAACEYMKQHYMEKVRLPQIAEFLGYDVTCFAKFFRAKVGMPPGIYLQSLRIDRALDMLASGNIHITDIALSTGFSSSQNFARVFRKFTGKSPGKCRKKE